jgi:hypothetical protein
MGQRVSPASEKKQDVSGSFTTWLATYVAAAGPPEEILGLPYRISYPFSCFLRVEGEHPFSAEGLFTSSNLWHNLPLILADCTTPLLARLETGNGSVRYLRDVEDILPYLAAIFAGLVESLGQPERLAKVLSDLKSGDTKRVASSIVLVSGWLKNRHIEGVGEADFQQLTMTLVNAFNHAYRRAFWRIPPV